MRRLIVICFYLSTALYSFSQVPVQYKSGEAAEDNLNRILNLNPTGSGGMGFDSRYQGVKGSPTLFDTLLTSFVRLSGSEEYLKLNSDFDIYQNNLIFSHPKTGKLQSLPAKYVSEVITRSDSGDKVFITTINLKFEKEIKEVKFLQVLKDGQFSFVKMPVRNLIEANYKNAYSAGIKYDEFEALSKYFVMCGDSIYRAIQLNKKSLIKLFPDKKKLIESLSGNLAPSDNEEYIISILSRF